MMKLLNKALDFWILRWSRLSPAYFYFRAGLVIMGFAFPIGWGLELLIQNEQLSGGLALMNSNNLPVIIRYVILLTGFSSVLWSFKVHHSFQKERERRKVIVVEQRGLRVLLSSTVADDLPLSLIGTPDPILIDHTPFVDDSGTVTDPRQSLTCISNVRTEIQSRVRHMDKQDTTIVYGGLASVPFTFLAGQLIDDEHKTLIMDWDRGASHWRELNGDEVVVLPAISGVEQAIGQEEVIIGIAISYPLEMDAIKTLHPDLPVISFSSDNFKPDNHWNAEQQATWVDAITGIIRQLCNGETKKLHVFIAAQSSVVFNIGRSFDNRLYPETLVYQYDRNTEIKYPWGLRVDNQSIFYTSNPDIEQEIGK